MSRRYSSFDQVVFCYVHTWLFCCPFFYQNNGIKSYGSFFLQCPTDGLDRERSLVILEVVWENWTFVTVKVIVTADCVGWCSSISFSLCFNGNTSWQVPIFRFIFICNFVRLVATLHVYPGAQHSFLEPCSQRWSFVPQCFARLFLFAFFRDLVSTTPSRSTTINIIQSNLIKSNLEISIFNLSSSIKIWTEQMMRNKNHITNLGITTWDKTGL